ncbi:PilC/PilY family type IV pilus protein [Desulfomicrobium sp. ZS1]|uniref:pilus assembly protein n=1 Tax=Desulfomicrobium sp. ZS1 TaxID=2952228 RepID=UPI0020B19FFA|nr:PilC/PilY family type IV pilus protein [Desulfomicrobium sp. ZS1]UTF50236.1 PilC/PilY family type IV pilus protein [Desulfomicrobium sp. ZS1]
MRYFYILLASVTILLSAYGNLLAAHGMSCGLYTSEPPFLTTNVAPSTHIILDNSGSMHEHAYAEVAVNCTLPSTTAKMRGYSGFNPTKEYYGYFDPKAYYLYSIDDEYFYKDSSGNWNGNFLNWALMHRVDVTRKVLTGGPFQEITPGYGTYKIERTDGSNNFRGMYHAYDDSTETLDLNNNTSFMTPFQSKIVLEQRTPWYDDYLYIGNVKTIVDNTWQIESFDTQNYKQKVYSEKKYGVLDRFDSSLRFSLFKFNTQYESEGAEILNYMGTNSSVIADSINKIYPNTNTPLAESLYTVCGYIQYNKAKDGTPPRYTKYSYAIDKNYIDPFYFKDKGNIYCSQQNVVIITDGEPTKDTNLPASLFPTDNMETGWLDDVAYWAHTTDMREGDPDFPDRQAVNVYTVFAFGSGSNLLKSAAKYGGFVDADNGTTDHPDPGEYGTGGDANPDNFFEAENGNDLELALTVALNSAANRVSAGAASSVVSTSRSGQGLLYQSVFYPKLFGDTLTFSTDWAGDVFAYWIDDYGLLHEDDGDVDYKLDSKDSRVIIYSKGGSTYSCNGTSVENDVCIGGTDKPISEVEFVWRASDWLNNISNATDNRDTLFDDTNKRLIFTWNDDGDGMVEQDEFGAFTKDEVNLALCPEEVVDWVRGQDQPGMRSRQIDIGIEKITWRLGDIINSSSVAVAAPSENYDLIWKDKSYTQFYKDYKNRRIMIYFGANDGMLHALNGGFYDPYEKKYWSHITASGNYTDTGGLAIGAEMWAYVPYNLQPQLACLAQSNYKHEYFVDLSPRIFDARIFEPDDDHPNGWGTILVGGMRFGGDGQQDLVVNGKTFGSSYFIFDITNPEKNPIFLGEITFDYTKPYTFGFTVGAPTLVPVKDSSYTAYMSDSPTDNVRWFLVFGTGPESTGGFSSNNARVVIVPLDQIVDRDTTNNINGPRESFPLRITSDIKPGTLNKTTIGHQEIPKTNSFVSTDFASVDYNFDFFVDILYYGVTEKDKNKPFIGSIHRLKVEDGADPSSWNQMKLMDGVGPITGTPNIGFYEKNVWVYFGTGKFWDISDKTDFSTQTLYGVMEPKKTESAYNFSNIDPGALVDVSDVEVVNDGLGTLNCTSTCSDIDKVSPKTVFGLRDYIVANSNVDGWKRNLEYGERVIGQPTLFGGLVNFVAYTPNNDPCNYGGSSALYALYYLTGTAWIENIFGDEEDGANVTFRKELGLGMGTTASLHIGSQDGTKAFVTLDDGTVVEVDEPNLPIKRVRTGKGGWHTINID